MTNKEKIGLFTIATLGGILILILILWGTAALSGGLVKQTTDFFIPDQETSKRDQIYQVLLLDTLTRGKALAIIKDKEQSIAKIDSISESLYKLVDEDLSTPLPETHFSPKVFNGVFRDGFILNKIPFIEQIQEANFYKKHGTLQDLLPVFAKAKIDIKKIEFEQLEDLLQQKRE